MKLNIILLAGLVLGASSLASAQAPSLDARVSLDIVEQPLSEVVKYLRDRSGANVVILDGSGDKLVKDLDIQDVDWRDALDYACQMAGCVVTEDRSGVLTITDPPRVDFDFEEDREIAEICHTIGKVAGVNILVSPEVTGTLRVRLKDVPWRSALEEVAKTRGYVVVEEQRGILRVVDPLSLEKQKQTRSYQLRYLRPKGPRKATIETDVTRDLAEGQELSEFSALAALEKALSPEGDLDYIEDSNVIIVRDTIQVHEAITQILDRIDIEPTQVFVDVKFVSTANIDLLDLGVDYGDGGPQVNISGGQIPIQLPFSSSPDGWQSGILADPGALGPFDPAAPPFGNAQIPNTVFGALSFTQVSATLKALQRDTRSEVVQAPKIITLDGNEATIFVGETVRYAEARAEQGQAGGLSLSVQEASGSPVEVGFQLLVRPNVIPGTRKIMMEVIPKETSLSGSSPGTALAPAGFDVFTLGADGVGGSIALPRTRSSTLITNMMLESGQTAVIGGLTNEVDTEVESRVPLLGSIPIVGELFRHRNSTRDRRSLVIFVTPQLVNNAEDTEYLLQQELQRRRTGLKDEIEALVNPAFAAPGAP